MKGKKRRFLLIATFIIIGFVACCGAIYFLLQKYFFYNEHNIHAQRAAWESLNAVYQQEFELLSTEFETKEVRIGGAKYVHMWTYEFQDSQGGQFYTYVRLYGVSEKGDGNSHAPDYSSYIDDTYGQLCIEERLGDKFDLYKYRQEKASRFPNREDYIFICAKDNAEEIAEILTEIYFEEMKFSNSGCLLCLVNNEEGEKLFSYFGWSITRKLQEQDKEITKETVYTYILQEIQN